jgi:hypothetical protein
VDAQHILCWRHEFQNVFGAPWVQNMILAVTAIIGLSTLGASSRQERRRATVDVLLEGLNDPKMREARITVRRMIDSGLNVAHLLSEEGLEDRLIIISILNRYEFMAAGLHEGAFDTSIYRRMYNTNIISDWDDLRDFIMAYRESRKRPTTFQELEKLVRIWKKTPLKAYYETPKRY